MKPSTSPSWTALTAAQQSEVRDDERQRIARDIHDDLGQHLLSLKIELSLLRMNAGSAHPMLRQRLDTMAGNLDQTISSLRAIINNLRPQGLEQGLRAAIEGQLAEFARLNNVHCNFEADAQAFAHGADEQRDAALFRILQEALANVARHARATELHVALRLQAARLVLTVRDNGVGMPREQAGAACAQGCGLDGIGQRVAQAGGRFAIDSEPGAGTELSLSFPLEQAITCH
jgi:signal transduction histidine kinase